MSFLTSGGKNILDESILTERQFKLQCSRAREHKNQFFSLKILESTKFVVKPPDFLHTYLDMFSMTCASFN